MAVALECGTDRRGLEHLRQQLPLPENRSSPAGSDPISFAITAASETRSTPHLRPTGGARPPGLRRTLRPRQRYTSCRVDIHSSCSRQEGKRIVRGPQGAAAAAGRSLIEHASGCCVPSPASIVIVSAFRRTNSRGTREAAGLALLCMNHNSAGHALRQAEPLLRSARHPRLVVGDFPCSARRRVAALVGLHRAGRPRRRGDGVRSSA